ncbi:MAG: hypothetical protein QGG36_08155 [Pirellulaceae bacterium]|jgi:hypothetical protein|nr:hypothetical protein [Pirellulaceae bacterium]MDP7015756.1 hypothetical protein [Pirellulaceae bacterium]
MLSTKSLISTRRLLGSVAVCVSSSLLGCGGGGADAPELSINSVESPRGEAVIDHWLIGQWHGVMQLDLENLKKDPTIKPEHIETLKTMEMDVEFRDDARMFMSASMTLPSGEEKSTSEASWQIVEDDGQTVKIYSTEAGGQAEEVVVHRHSATEFIMPAPRGAGFMRFTRR